MTAQELMSLAERVESGTGCDNALDVQVEIALFNPCGSFQSIRANAAGSKIIVKFWDNTERTCWADDWTMDRPKTAASLRARASSNAGGRG